MRSLLLLWLLSGNWLPELPTYSTEEEICGGAWEKDIKKGDPVTLCSTVQKDPGHPALLYLRIRRSQSQNGFYEIWQKVPFDALTEVALTDGRRFYRMNVTFPAAVSYHYFATAVYSEKDADGNPILKESTGSGHGRVNVIP